MDIDKVEKLAKPQPTINHHNNNDNCYEEIKSKINVYPTFDQKKGRQSWNLLDQFQYVFAWNKKELGCCSVGEHIVDTQGFPPCGTTPSKLSF